MDIEHIALTFCGLAILGLLIWRAENKPGPIGTAVDDQAGTDIVDPMEGRTVFNYNQLPGDAYVAAWASIPLTAIPVTKTMSYKAS